MKTDKQIQQDVIAELGWAPSVNAAHIGVEVSNGVVNLAGHVSSYAEKLNAERAAQRVSGVKALAVEMDVRLGGTSRRNDSDIAVRRKPRCSRSCIFRRVASRSRLKTAGSRCRETSSGTIRGRVQSTPSAIWWGVTGVSDQIAIKPTVSSTLVKSDIEAALKRRARTDAQNISVDVQGTDVTLTGPVHSWSERDLAKESAWSTPGVRNVIDKMTVSY